MDKQVVEKHILAWSTPDGFRALFCRMRGEYSSDVSAYTAAERIFFSHYGHTKYASYESFKNCRNQQLRNRVKK